MEQGLNFGLHRLLVGTRATHKELRPIDTTRLVYATHATDYHEWHW